jgi:hypothetical protein
MVKRPEAMATRQRRREQDMTNISALLIDEAHLDPEVSLKIYQALLAWASRQGSRFEITLQRSVYDSPDDLRSLSALGAEKSAAARQVDELQIAGKPGSSFVQALTGKQAPARAIAGDNSPVEDVVIFIDDRRLYGSYDYGRTQLLNVTDEEASAVKEILRGLGLGADVLVPAPRGPGPPDSS